jgi:hypothetical protein
MAIGVICCVHLATTKHNGFSFQKSHRQATTKALLALADSQIEHITCMPTNLRFRFITRGVADSGGRCMCRHVRGDHACMISFNLLLPHEEPAEPTLSISLDFWKYYLGYYYVASYWWEEVRCQLSIQNRRTYFSLYFAQACGMWNTSTPNIMCYAIEREKIVAAWGQYKNNTLYFPSKKYSTLHLICTPPHLLTGWGAWKAKKKRPVLLGLIRLCVCTTQEHVAHETREKREETCVRAVSIGPQIGGKCMLAHSTCRLSRASLDFIPCHDIYTHGSH